MGVRLGSYLNHIKNRRLTNWSIGVSTTFEIGKNQKGRVELPVNLVFGDYTLSIYNSFEIDGISDLNELVGLDLKNFTESERIIYLNWSKDISIKVFLDDDSYCGPEAMVLTGPNNMSVVWN